MKIEVSIPIYFTTEIEVKDDILSKEDIEFLKNDIWENMDRKFDEVETKMVEKYEEFLTFIKNTKFNVVDDESRSVLYCI